MTSATASQTIALWVRLECPYGHKLPVNVPKGTLVNFRCRDCGRVYEFTVR